MLRGATLTPRSAAISINKVLLSVDAEGLDAIKGDLTTFLDDPLLEKRALAMAAFIRMGEPMRPFAERDRAALLTAVESMKPEHLPATARGDLVAMVDDGSIAFGRGVLAAARLSSDYDALFEWLQGFIDPARHIGFDQWGEGHVRAMAAVRGMHEVDFEDWPDGYEDYVVPPAEQTVYKLGHDLYHLEERGCVRCHGEHGEGIEGFPPLALSPWVLGDPGRPAAIVVHGLAGTLTMPDGRVFANANMSPEQKGAMFSDADVAAILTYIRQSWGNYAWPVTARDIQTAPKPMGPGSWVTDDLLIRFPLTRDRVLVVDMPAGPSIETWHAPRGGLLMMLAAVFGGCTFLGGLTYWASRVA